MGGDAADDGSARYELGVSLWEKGEDRARAAAEFVAAAKSNPENAAAFRYLGEFYSGEEGRDPAKAAKCYGRAVGLDPLDWRSGEALCDLLEGEGKDSVAEAVCRRACEKSAGKAAWALRREGFLMVGRGEWLAGVPRLQQAIRARPACPLLWEALALSYQRLSRFSAALKSYAKALELDPQALFPAVQTGNLYLSLGVYDKAVEAFRGASGRCVAASYGLGSALLAHANHCASLGAFRWAAQLLEEAAGVARAAAGRASNSSSLWKLLADIHLAYAKCYPWSQPLEVSEEAFEKSVESWRQTCTSAAISARWCYQRALILSPTQPNLYADIAIASHLINSSVQCHQASWNLPEKMALGSLLLEPQNHDLWVVLGYLSHRPALKQHALLRGLHLDVSLAVAWAYLGKVYRKENEKQLARQAFDCSRSIDPSLALPWAGMSASFQPGQPGADEAFESCLRAVQTLPLSEFQIGLAKLAAASGHLSSPQVFGAIEQAVQRSPHFPEVHNLKGLVFEARFDYHSAANSYRLARCALTAFPSSLSKCLIQDISVNLARSLSKAGNDVDTAHECENLKAEGLLDAEGLQIYALSLWRLGQSNLALSVAKNLATSVPSMERTLAAASISLICRLLYCISGLDSAIRSISKMPKELFQSCRVSFIVSAIHALDHSNSLVSVVSSSRNHVKSHEDTTKMHFLIALSKLIKSGTKSRLGYLSGVAHVRKALHMYPNSNLLRNLMGYLLIWGGGWNGVHSATRFCSGDGPMRGLKSSDEVAGVLGVACYALCTPTPRLSFPTCSYHCPTEPPLIQRLQRWLRREPWNQSVRYLLILNLAQKAREERFPRHLCVTLERLIHVALSSKCYSGSDTSSCYQKFSLLLCASETSLRGGNRDRCVQYAKKAALISLPDSHLFFAHLLLCRAYASCGDFLNLEKEYKRCLELKTDCDIGLVCLKLVEYQCGVQNGSEFELTDIWMAISNLVEGLALLRKQEFVAAEEVLRRGCALAGGESCLELCHGVSCLEAVKQQWSSELLPVAIRSLNRAEKGSPTPLPFVSALLGQAQGGLGSKDKWENKLRLEWNAWPPEMRPAELFFQMHLLAKQERRSDSSNIEHCQTPQKWVLRAIHTNPSCTRYWKVLHQLDKLNHSLPLL